MKVLSDIDVLDKRVFLRADLDLNLEQLTIDNLQLTGAIRLQNLKPTVDYLLEHGAKQIVIAGHMGRPRDKNQESRIMNQGNTPPFYDTRLSTENLVGPLERILGQIIAFSEQLTASSSEQFVESSLQIVLLENLRFWEGEEKNDPEFAKILASLADVYVNDAFGVCHRVHASVVGVPALLPHGAGLHLEKEVSELIKLTRNPNRPMVAIIGGAKLETKIPVIESMAEIADWVLVGGLVAQEFQINTNKYQFQISNKNKILVAELTGDTKDITEESIGQFTEIIKTVKTVVWNGPMGNFEEGFERGTQAIADSIIESKAYSVVGGGETTEFLANKGLLNRFSFVSSGGGAMLEFLSGKELPALKALE